MLKLTANSRINSFSKMSGNFFKYFCNLLKIGEGDNFDCYFLDVTRMLRVQPIELKHSCHVREVTEGKCKMCKIRCFRTAQRSDKRQRIISAGARSTPSTYQTSDGYHKTKQAGKFGKSDTKRVAFRTHFVSDLPDFPARRRR